MSRFIRALEGTLSAAQLTQSEVAARTGLAQSTVSRILRGDFMPEHETLGKLLAVLPDLSDRLHCLREYLVDQTPDDYRESLAISFGKTEEPKPRPVDTLGRAIRTLEARATDDADLRKLVLDLAVVFEKTPLHVAEDQANYGLPSAQKLLDASAPPARPITYDAPKKRGVRPAARGSSKTVRD